MRHWIAMAAGALVLTGCTADKSCTSLYVVREMKYSATLPAGLDVASTQLELCVGSLCDTSRLVGTHCEDVDGHTLHFQTTCSFAESERRLDLGTNTAADGHARPDHLTLTAIEASGARSEVLRGTVTYEDQTDDSARAACTEAWQGTFVPD
jgi:hypothetical protein